eukprot:CAMPEP_0115340268 /NCGR_PEP_ID=MMETSP0270-20121206/91058_1 /TAXON_ID=71861 /ORGANISM="Scrippsiella trochoidea, Strain CCMP3099" /LENGTH=101 /DNA_ID=CAMNT_0002761715 /DNA_START=159 /DNA_END=464 /DNA_ORIENTATION=+
MACSAGAGGHGLQQLGGRDFRECSAACPHLLGDVGHQSRVADNVREHSQADALNWPLAMCNASQHYGNGGGIIRPGYLAKATGGSFPNLPDWICKELPQSL